MDGPWEWVSKLRLEGKWNEAFGKEWDYCVRGRDRGEKKECAPGLALINCMDNICY